MAMRSRNTPPPYQVMKACPPVVPGQGGAALGAGGKGDSAMTGGMSGGVSGGGGLSGGGIRQWLIRSNQPVALRVPRGFIFLLGVIFVLVLVISYWVGNSQGYKRGFEVGVSGPPVLPVPGHESGLGVASGSVAGSGTRLDAGGSSGNRVSGGPVQPGVDARKKGHNYLVLAHYPESQIQEVTAMVQFLWSQGVEAQAIKRHNSRSFQVLALQGFTREDLGSTALKQYQQRLKEIGRLWKSRKPGSTDWSGMYLDRFDGESADLVITREN